MEPVGRRCPWRGLCGQPLAETEGCEEPGAHPYFRLAANPREARRGKHERHQASGWLRHVENHQVPAHLPLSSQDRTLRQLAQLSEDDSFCVKMVVQPTNK